MVHATVLLVHSKSLEDVRSCLSSISPGQSGAWSIVGSLCEMKCRLPLLFSFIMVTRTKQKMDRLNHFKVCNSVALRNAQCCAVTLSHFKISS